MNIFSNKRALSNLLLLSALLAPGLALADADTAAAVREMDSHVSGKLDTLNGTTDGVRSAVGQSNEYLRNISEKSDISNKDMVTALMNYWAQASIKEFGLAQEKYFQVAPSTEWAAKAGIAAGNLSYVQNSALNRANLTMVRSLGFLSRRDTFNIGGVEIAKDEIAPMRAMSLYKNMLKFYDTGDIATLGVVNAAGIMQKNLIPNDEASRKVTQDFVNIVTNPFPVVDPELDSRIKGGGLNGEDMEKIGTIIAQYSLLGVSANAWTDIVARREQPILKAQIDPATGECLKDGAGNCLPVPVVGPSKSTMQLMDEAANKRFTNPDWYASLSDASETALLREIAHMLAYNQWVQYQQFRLAEQQVSLLASINGVMAKLNTSIDAMTVEMQKAQAEAKIQAKKAEEKAAEAKAEAEEQAKKAQEQADKAAQQTSP